MSGGLNQKDAVVILMLAAISAFASRYRKSKNIFFKMAGRRNFRLHTDIYPAVLQTNERGGFLYVSLARVLLL
jgi:hypothetical protein